MDKSKDNNDNIRRELEDILNASRTITLYRQIRNESIWLNFESFLEEILRKNSKATLLMELYYNLLNDFLDLSQRAKGDVQSWKEGILYRFLHIDNGFTQLAETGKTNIPKPMIKALNHDMDCIRKIANTPWKDIVSLLKNIGTNYDYLDILSYERENTWEDCIYNRGLSSWTGDSLIEYYEQIGSGILGRYKAFYWNGKAIEGIENTDPITLDQLIGYDMKKQTLMDNTERFISGHPANNVLLYGDKGTGKSSMVKALIHKYGCQGLRIIELPKIHMEDYHKILNFVEGRKFKFILYIDDLSFEEHEVEYKHVKALLEGGLRVRPSNLLVYATSNRRHLIKEMVSDRDEISSMDSMQEKQSLSDRFGITLTFVTPTQKEYLQMVKSMADQRGIGMDQQELYSRALEWEKRYNGRSGRTARQFIDDLES